MQDSLSSRRRFLGWSTKLLAIAGLASRPLSAEKSYALEGADYYEKLGVAKIINAAGTYTALTASTMPPSVTGAVARAARHPVRLVENTSRANPQARPRWSPRAPRPPSRPPPPPA